MTLQSWKCALPVPVCLDIRARQSRHATHVLSLLALRRPAPGLLSPPSHSLTTFWCQISENAEAGKPSIRVVCDHPADHGAKIDPRQGYSLPEALLLQHCACNSISSADCRSKPSVHRTSTANFRCLISPRVHIQANKGCMYEKTVHGRVGKQLALFYLMSRSLL